MVLTGLVKGSRLRSVALYLGLTLAFSIRPGSEIVLAQKPTRQVPVDSLLYDLKNPDPARRKEAAMLLGNNKVQRALPDLVAAAGDKDPAVRREIIIALDNLADIRSLPAFIELTGDPEAEIFGIIGDSQAVPVLQELSNDHRGQITALCNQALRRIAARPAGQTGQP